MPKLNKIWVVFHEILEDDKKILESVHTTKEAAETARDTLSDECLERQDSATVYNGYVTIFNWVDEMTNVISVEEHEVLYD